MLYIFAESIRCGNLMFYVIEFIYTLPVWCLPIDNKLFLTLNWMLVFHGVSRYLGYEGVYLFLLVGINLSFFCKFCYFHILKSIVLFENPSRGFRPPDETLGCNWTDRVWILQRVPRNCRVLNWNGIFYKSFKL